MDRARIVACIGAVVLTLGVSGLVTAEVGDASWGWVVVRSPARTYSPGSKDHRTSAGTAVSVIHGVTGAYSVTLHGVGAPGGTTLVTSMDSNSLCHPDVWNASPADELIEVRCFSLTGVPKDSAFSLSWYAIASAPAGSIRNAYLWANDSSSAGYTPPAQYSFNGMGGTNSITRGGVGRYLVTLGAMAKAGGQPQVTAKGTSIGTCRVEDWQVSDADIRISVSCRKPSGSHIDQEFDLSFTNRKGLLAFDHPFAYLWADRPSTSSYHPNATYRYSYPTVVTTITRASRGVYTVKLVDAPWAVWRRSRPLVREAPVASSARSGVLGRPNRSGSVALAPPATQWTAHSRCPTPSSLLRDCSCDSDRASGFVRPDRVGVHTGWVFTPGGHS